jgi:predicted dehydrogenase
MSRVKQRKPFITTWTRYRPAEGIWPRLDDSPPDLTKPRLMNILIVGLGSMGKRRVRCLQHLGYGAEQIHGFDLREDRRAEAAETYGIHVHDAFDSAFEAAQPGAMVISVPPDVHHIYMKKALNLDVPFFVEASVVDEDLEAIIQHAEVKEVLAVPSATMLFHPAIKTVRRIIDDGILGKLSHMSLHAGQYLPDWHTYEAVEDFYVSQPETGGAREIVPFELTWVTTLFGFPKRVAGVVGKTIDIEGAEAIDDTYNFILDYDGFMVTGIVDVVSRSATRRIVINGERGQLIWDWVEEEVRVYDGENGAWTAHPYDIAAAADGYDAKIGETMYIEEVRAFLNAVTGGGAFPNSLEEDLEVLRLLYAIEDASDTGHMVPYASAQPVARAQA